MVFADLPLAIKHEAVRFKVGSVLLWTEMKVASGLMRRVLKGEVLARRERIQVRRMPSCPAKLSRLHPSIILFKEDSFDRFDSFGGRVVEVRCDTMSLFTLQLSSSSSCPVFFFLLLTYIVQAHTWRHVPLDSVLGLRDCPLC